MTQQFYFDPLIGNYVAGTTFDDDNILIGNATAVVVDTRQGGVDYITAFTSNYSTYLSGKNSVTNIISGDYNNFFAEGNATANFENATNTQIYTNATQPGFVAEIEVSGGVNTTLHLSPGETYSAQPVNNSNGSQQLIVQIFNSENQLQARYNFHDYIGNAPIIDGVGFYCSPVTPAISVPEETPDIDVCLPAEEAISEYEIPPTLEDVYTPTLIEPIELGTPSVIVTPPPVVDTPKVEPTIF